MGVIELNLVRKLEEGGTFPVRLIVRVKGDIEEQAARLEAMGCHVLSRLWLINAVAMECTSAQALRLAEEPWVERIEPDSVVSAQEWGIGNDYE
ncbi:MAG: hypothetical protein H5T64_07520 [Chloroflexi bacterium]|nr:hypothetical protein [Chloroflexota bacterium]